MLFVVIFALTFVIAVIAIVKYLNKGCKRVTTIPGMDASDPKKGNFPDIVKAGNLHEFLQQLHGQFGDIASFWFGESYCVSIASPALFKEHSRVFDRPPELFQEFGRVWTLECIQMANGADGRARRSLYDPCYSHHAVKLFHDKLKEVAQGFVDKLQTVSTEEHIPLEQNMFLLAIKAMAITSFGSFFKDDAKMLEFKRSNDIALCEAERWAFGAKPELDSLRRIEEAKKYLFDTMKNIMEDRQNDLSAKDERLFIDTLMASGRPKSEILCDGLQFIFAGFHTSSSMLTWGLYFLALHPEIQDKVYHELVDVLGDEDIQVRDVPELIYMRQVLDETLRCAMVAPYAARVQFVDSQLGGHKVPAGTPVIHALGVVMQDEKLWPEPMKFDPERFSRENSKNTPKYAFEPFGFAGKRKCPGYRFPYSLATVVFAMLLRRFKFKMAPGQDVTSIHTIIIRVKGDIWVTVEKR